MGLIAIGDIHGCALTLDALLDQLSPTADDHLVFMGDYIDRGPDSKGVIERLMALQKTHPCTFLRGNHEALMLACLDQYEYELWAVNGGNDTLRSYGIREFRFHDLPEDHVAFVRATEFYYETPTFFFVHAGLKPHLTVEQNKQTANEEVYLWERSHLHAPSLVWEKTVVCGHTPQHEPINREQLILIDTGCVYKHPRLGRLTAVRLPERAFVVVNYVG
jgi:serine/threonine protein phosphatase 1